MEYADYLAQLTVDASSLTAALAGADLAAPVRSCPGWSLADLGSHVAAVYQHKISAMRTGARPDPWPPEPLPELWRRPVPEFLAISADGLLNELSGRNAAQPCWTWFAEDHTVGFWARRMAQETVIHLWDARDALGQPAPIGSRIAADGIDELLVAFLSGDWSDEPQPAPFGVVDVQTHSDRWRIELAQDAVAVYRPPAEDGAGQTARATAEEVAAATISGRADGLLLALWGRQPLAAGTGDAALVDALRHRLALVTR